MPGMGRLGWAAWDGPPALLAPIRQAEGDERVAITANQPEWWGEVVGLFTDPPPAAAVVRTRPPDPHGDRLETWPPRARADVNPALAPRGWPGWRGPAPPAPRAPGRAGGDVVTRLAPPPRVASLWDRVPGSGASSSGASSLRGTAGAR
jgi:hypothetical protein